MHFGKLATSFAAAISVAAALPAADTAGEGIQLSEPVLVRHDDPRRAAVPPECAFESKTSGIAFKYSKITGLDGDACFGWIPQNCGDGQWGEPDISDIKGAMAKQVSQDGQWEVTEKGRWTANFYLGTSAFGDRNTGPFNSALAAQNQKHPKYYWSRNGNFAGVSLPGETCP